MSILDNQTNLPDPANVPMRPTAMKYGAYAAGITIILGLIFYVAGVQDFSQQGGTGNTIASLVNYAVLIGALVMAIKYHKENELGGYITLGRSVGIGTLTALVAGIISAVWTFIFFGLIDPGALEQIREVAYEQAIANGAPEDQMDQMEGMMNFFTSPTFFAIVIILGSVIIGAIVSLIAGAILKKDPPPFA